MLEDYDTWIDTEGEFADPGTEFIFDPRKDHDHDNTQSTQQSSQSTVADEEESGQRVETQQSLSESDDLDEQRVLMKDGRVI